MKKELDLTVPKESIKLDSISYDNDSKELGVKIVVGETEIEYSKTIDSNDDKVMVRTSVLKF